MARSGIVVLVLAVGLLLAHCSEGGHDQAGAYQGETTARLEPTAPTTTTSSSLGIDFRSCPKAEPEEPPPDALAGATEAALEQVPSVFGEVKSTEGAYALAVCGAPRRGGPDIPEALRPSASLSQHTVFVARFEGDY
jgi:hypothetical protein